ncbi:MAG: dephospho-CoA kinase [Mariniphaga sp.]
MKKIGITGGIGSGKTTACEIFKLLGVPVFHADTEARNLQNNDLTIKKRLIELFGGEIYTDDGMLDRKQLAKIIFNNHEALLAVNTIIHPAVRQCFMKWLEKHQNSAYVLYEAAILFESGYASDFDKIILILADEAVRIRRVVHRDGTSEDLVKQRISNQIPDFEKIDKADHILENNGFKLLLPEIIKLDQLIREDGKIR